MSVDSTPRTPVGLYAKAIAASAVAVLAAYGTAIQDGGGVVPVEWVAIAVSFVASFGLVWLVPQTPRWLATYGKAVFAGLAGALSVLGTSWSDGTLTQNEIITAIIAFIIGSGLTGTVSNAAASDPVGPDGRLVAVPADVKDAMVADGVTSVVRTGRTVSLESERDDRSGL